MGFSREYDAETDPDFDSEGLTLTVEDGEFDEELETEIEVDEDREGERLWLDEADDDFDSDCEELGDRLGLRDDDRLGLRDGDALEERDAELLGLREGSSAMGVLLYRPTLTRSVQA